MPGIGGPKGEHPLAPATEADGGLSMREKIIGGAAMIISAVMIYKGMKPGFEPPYAIDVDWLASGGIGLTTIALYNQARKHPEQD